MSVKRRPRLSCLKVNDNGGYEFTEVGLETVTEMAAEGASIAEIARYLRVTPRFLQRMHNPDDSKFDINFSDAYDDGRHEYILSLRRNQKVLSESNAQMAIHLGKHYLEQDDKPVEHNHLHRVVGTLPDYNATSEEWARQFAPSALQHKKPIELDVEDAEVVVAELTDATRKDGT